jgi:hypothetical protein
LPAKLLLLHPACFIQRLFCVDKNIRRKIVFPGLLYQTGSCQNILQGKENQVFSQRERKLLMDQKAIVKDVNLVGINAKYIAVE